MCKDQDAHRAVGRLHLPRRPHRRSAGRRRHQHTRHEPHPGRQPGGPRLPGAGRGAAQGPQRAPARHGPLLPRRPRRGRVAGGHGVDPRQRHHHRAIRRHAPQCAGRAGGAGRRARAARWQPRPQELLGLRPYRAAGGQRGHTGHHHRAGPPALRPARGDAGHGDRVRVAARGCEPHGGGDAGRHPRRQNRGPRCHGVLSSQPLQQDELGGVSHGVHGAARHRVRC
mmetsp:Transcript_6814/g.21312  ORF Transcript_6814/g.21312 Transcript_6814/m.21312 type:complete len:226 (+) Transcript_6814:253-930(+)